MSIKQAILKTLEENKKLTTLKEIYEFIKSYFLAELKSKTTKSTIYTNKIKKRYWNFVTIFYKIINQFINIVKIKIFQYTQRNKIEKVMVYFNNIKKSI